MPGKSTSFQPKSSKLNFSSTSRVEKGHQKPVMVYNNSSSDQSNASAVDLADDTVLSKVSRKNSTTSFSGSDINRTLASEVKSGKMSKDLAQLVINLSKNGSQMFPLPKVKASELRSWILAADSGCLKLPLSVQNHLIYAIRVNDNECSAAQNSRNLKVSSTGTKRNVKATSQICDLSDNDGFSSNVSVGKKKVRSKLTHAKGQPSQRLVCCNALGRALGKSGRNKLKCHPTSIRHRSFLTNKTRQQELTNSGDDIHQCAARKRSGSLVTSRSYVTGSVVSNEDDSVLHTGMQPQVSRRKSAEKTAPKHLLRRTSGVQKRSLNSSTNHNQTSDSGIVHDKKSLAKKSSVSSVSASSSPSFDEEAHNVISKINHTLQIRRKLRNSDSLNTNKAPALQYTTSKCQRMSDNGKQFPASTGLKECKLQHSPSSSTTEDSAATSSGMSQMLWGQNFKTKTHLQKLVQQQARSDRSCSITGRSSKSSLVSQECPTNRKVASNKATFCKSSSDRSARTQDSTTSGLPWVVDSCTSSFAAHRSLGLISSKTQEDLTFGKILEDPDSIRPTSVGNKPDDKSNHAVVKSNDAGNEKVGTNSKESKQNNKVPLPWAVRDSKLCSRWSDIGNWNGKIYTVKPATSSSKMQTAKSDNVKQRRKSADSDFIKKAANEQFHQQASDKSSTETVVSFVTSKSSLNSDADMTASSFSLADNHHPQFNVHATEDPSDSKTVLLKRHVEKPWSVANASTSGEKEAPKKRTGKIPISVSSWRGRQKTSSRATSETQSLQSVVSDTAVSPSAHENSIMADKRSRKPDNKHLRMSRLSDTESAVSNSTYVAEDSWHFGVPPQAWMGPWSLRAANGSRSSLDTTSEDEEDRHSADTGTVRGDDVCSSCRLTTVASFDKAVSTDSEPGLSTTMLQTEATETDGQESDSRLEQFVDADTCIASRRFEHSVVTADTMSSMEDIQLETFPSGLFSVSSMDMTDELKNITEDECTASVSPCTQCVVNTGLTSAENEVKTIASVNQNADEQELGCEDSAAAPGSCLNDNFNNLAQSSSSGSPLSSDLQQSESSERSDIIEVFSSRSLAGKDHSSNSSSNLSLTRSGVAERSQLRHSSLPACAGSPDGTSLPAVPDDGNEKLGQSDVQRNANNCDNMLMQSLGSDSSSRSDVQNTADASVVRSGDVRGRMANVGLSSRQWTSEFKHNLGTFAIKTTLVPIHCSPVKHELDGQKNLVMAGKNIQTLKSSQSDTNYVSSKSAASSFPKLLSKETKYKPTQKPPGNRTDNDTCQVDSSTSSIEYLVSKSYDKFQKQSAEKVDQLVPRSCDSNTKHSDVLSTISCQSLNEPIRNMNICSDSEERKSSSAVELPDGGGKVNMSTSSSRVSESDTSAAVSLTDDSTDLNESTSSDKTVPDIDLGNHATCDPPSSSDDTCTQSLSAASVTGIDCDSPARASTSSGRNEERSNSAEVCCDRRTSDSRESVHVCLVDKRIPGADVCFDEILNARSCGCNHVQCPLHDAEYRGLCQSVAEFPAASRKFTPAADVFTRRSLPAFCRRDEERLASLISADRRRNISSTRAPAGARNNSRGVCVSNLADDGERNQCSDLSTDRTDPCDVGTRPWRSSPMDVRTHGVRVNCKSSYRVKFRRRPRRDGCCPTAVRSARETTASSTTTDAEDTCRASLRHDCDAMQRTANDIRSRETKRVSCSQRYRMSRAGHVITPSPDCTDDASAETAAGHRANDAQNLPVSNFGDKILDRTGVPDRVLQGGQERGGDVYPAEIAPSASKQADDQTDARAVAQVTDDKRAAENQPDVFATPPPQADSADVVATQEGEDGVDRVSSDVRRNEIVPSVPGAECRDLVCGDVELIRCDAKTKLAGDETAGAGNASMRPASPRARRAAAASPSAWREYTDDTASSASTSFSLSATDALTDDFVEVLSSRLLVALAKKQRQEGPAGGVDGAESSKPTAASGPATSQSDCIHPAAQGNLPAGPLDCTEPLSSRSAGGGRVPGVEGYLQRSECGWARLPAGARPAQLAGLQGELRATTSSTAAGYEVPFAVRITCSLLNIVSQHLVHGAECGLSLRTS